MVAELKTNNMSGPFKLKGGSSPMKHLFGKHPAKDGHVRSDHKERRAAKKATRDAEFEKTYGVHPDKTRRYADGSLINTETGEKINE